VASFQQDRQILFIYTNSYDFSADALIRRLGNAAVFRFNLDLWQDYAVTIDRGHFAIANAAGRTIDSSEVTKFLWRKPLTNQQLFPDRTFPRELVFEEEELAYAMHDAWNVMYLRGRAVLIDPLSDSVAGKLVQMQIASSYFQVPVWKVVSGTPLAHDSTRPQVVKSLTSMRTAARSVLFATRVDEDQLSSTSPWLLQEYVAAEHDVTVVAIRDALFAFSLSRAGFPADVIDWRRARNLAPTQTWIPHRLPRPVAAAIGQFMADMSLHYGRLDFLLKGDCYFFLEVNPNGEWGWLVESGGADVLDTLANELSPDTPCHPLPNPRIIKLEHRGTC
jgi:hypothetical protein